MSKSNESDKEHLAEAVPSSEKSNGKQKAEINFKTDWQYAASPESTDHIQLKKKYDLFINGKFVAPAKPKYFDSINPSTEEKIVEVAEADEADVNKAVKAARDAYKGKWSKISASERAKYMFRIARIIQEKARELAVIETMDGGKPIRESRDIDIPLAAAHFFYYAGWADKLNYAVPGKNPKPLGVAGQIIPWNFPLLMAAWKIAPALATGNTVVLKPAETTSLTALKLAEIIQEADLPPGVVNIVTGAGKTGSLIVNHPGVDKIAFTGSTDIGKLIQKSLAGTHKKYTLELGGKAANIVFEDASMDQAVEGIVNGIFFNQGHVCCAGSRLFVQESVFDIVMRKLKDRIATLVVGNPLDKNTDIGAINSKAQLDKISEYHAIGLKEGAECYQPVCDVPSKGYWFRPTVFWNVSQASRIVQEEIFGPVLTVQTFRTVQEVVEKANNTPYGLSGGIWTDKGSKIFKVSGELKAGVIWANTFNKFDPTSPFGGYKESGIGREGGLHGLMPYLQF
jgi:aldehyde dehydrogenase (NAD+)